MTQTILVVDDDSLMSVLTQRIFRSAEIEVATAADGEEGLRLARELLPAVIVVDIHLPGSIHGWEVIERLKSDEFLAAAPFIVVSAGTAEGDRERAEAAGCAAYMLKPVSLDALEAVITRHLP